MTVREKMHNMELYLPSDEEIQKEQQGYMERLYDFNHTRPSKSDKRNELLKELFAEFCVRSMNMTKSTISKIERLITAC